MSKVVIDEWLFRDKVGFDWANKKMIVRVYEHLKNVMESDGKKSWTEVIRQMLGKDVCKYNVNGYYGTIRRILSDIEVIEIGRGYFRKGRNWDRFYSDEDWSWFVTSTNTAGWGKIVK